VIEMMKVYNGKEEKAVWGEEHLGVQDRISVSITAEHSVRRWSWICGKRYGNTSSVLSRVTV